MSLKQQSDLAFRSLKWVAAHKFFSEMQADFFDDGFRN
jgi:hypothetical protein